MEKTVLNELKKVVNKKEEAKKELSKTIYNILDNFYNTVKKTTNEVYLKELGRIIKIDKELTIHTGTVTIRANLNNKKIFTCEHYNEIIEDKFLLDIAKNLEKWISEFMEEQKKIKNEMIETTNKLKENFKI